MAIGLPAPVRMACAQRVVAVVGTVCGKLSRFASPGADDFPSVERFCGGASSALADGLGAHLIEKYGSAAQDCDLSVVREGTLGMRWRMTDQDTADVAAWLAAAAVKADTALDAVARSGTVPQELREAASAAAEHAQQAWAWLGGDSGGWP